MSIPDQDRLKKVLDDLHSQCSSPINPHLAQITDKIKYNNDLSDDEAGEAMKLLMSEDIAEAQQAEFLVSMQSKGPTASELASFALTLRELAHPLPLELHPSQFPLGDTCGTGGGTQETFNVSTTIIFILAAAGITIAKHGNRAVTSSCGSADVLEALGVKIDLQPSSVKECIEELGIGFLFAPLFHKAFKNIMPIRKKLAPYTQTVFNLLGPLVNPAFGSCSDKTPCVHVLGVNDPGLVETFAQVLKILKIQRAMVVYGYSDHMGMDELSTVGKTKVSELKSDGTIDNYRIAPEEFGLVKASNRDLTGGSDNAQIITDILTGKETGPRRDLALLNAAAGLYVGGKADNIRTGIELAQSKIDDGSAKEKLDDFIRVTNQKV
jgi:anthranilate phosphoribosyltransferase